MKKRKLTGVIVSSLILLGLCTAGYLLYDRGRPAPIPVRQKLYEGVTYRRVVQFIPHPMIAHIIEIDTKANGIELLITPPDSDGETPLNARTTSQFLDEFDVQIAINGDGFSPWWSRSPADYYPHVGDPVAPLGLSASNGKVYSTGVQTTIGIKPTLYVSRRNVLSFNNPPNNIHSAISGDRMIVLKGELVADLNDKGVEPRTAIGMNRNGRYLYLVVVDGRQPFYSSGATFAELAQILIEQGAYIAMSLDGGGSSTMVIEGEAGEPVILNSPIDNYIPGRERPVANHLGIHLRGE
jgi:phosphodiester glycosidase